MRCMGKLLRSCAVSGSDQVFMAPEGHKSQETWKGNWHSTCNINPYSTWIFVSPPSSMSLYRKDGNIAIIISQSQCLGVWWYWKDHLFEDVVWWRVTKSIESWCHSFTFFVFSPKASISAWVFHTYGPLINSLVKKGHSDPAKKITAICYIVCQWGFKKEMRWNNTLKADLDDPVFPPQAAEHDMDAIGGCWADCLGACSCLVVSNTDTASAAVMWLCLCPGYLKWAWTSQSP